MDLRGQLEELAHRLHLVDDDKAKELGEDVQRSLDEEEHEGLGERLTESAVHFETDHPELSQLLLRVADFLSASGL